MNDSKKFDDRNYLNKEIKEMFFALGLIQSYGSGIRRAKNDMEYNHSPALVFEPTEENEYDYTMVTAFINKEFAEIRKEELEGRGDYTAGPRMPKNAQETTQKTTQKASQKTTQKTRDLILHMIEEDSEITQEQMAQQAGITMDGIKYHIKKLRNEGKIDRVGGDKGGKWIICK